MSSQIAVRQQPETRKNPPKVDGVPTTVHSEAAANDAAPPAAFSVFRDPLFGMAIASGILFAVLAALVAFS